MAKKGNIDRESAISKLYINKVMFNKNDFSDLLKLRQYFMHILRGEVVFFGGREMNIFSTVLRDFEKKYVQEVVFSTLEAAGNY